MKILIEKKYIWLPINNSKKTEIIEFFCDNKKIRELSIQLASKNEEINFWAYYNMSEYIGQFIYLKPLNKNYNIDLSVHQTNNTSLSLNPSPNNRFKLHFSAKIGWINDPNGLVFVDGNYHLFFQHNPVGLSWGNMHWGHARSKNLLDWEQLDEAIYPDKFGEAFSGSALYLNDKKIILYYTTAGGDSNWSETEQHAQRMCIYQPENNKIIKTDSFLSNIQGSNRDPKLIYHQETDAYVMLLYLDENEYAILRSPDLKTWQKSSTISVPKAWECPELYQLIIENTGESQWVFSVADGFYYLCEFDGYSIFNLSDLKKAYHNELPYAAQSYNNVEDRVINQVWLRTDNTGDIATGVMAIPVELSLYKINSELYLIQKPVHELTSYWKNTKHATEKKVNWKIDNESAYEMKLNFHETFETKVSVEIFNQLLLKIDFSSKKICINNKKFSLPNFFNLGKNECRIIVDNDIIEIYLFDGLFYFSMQISNLNSKNLIKILFKQSLSQKSELYW